MHLVQPQIKSSKEHWEIGSEEKMLRSLPINELHPGFGFVDGLNVVCSFTF